MRKRSNIYIADTSSQRTDTFLGQMVSAVERFHCISILNGSRQYSNRITVECGLSYNGIVLKRSFAQINATNGIPMNSFGSPLLHACTDDVPDPHYTLSTILQRVKMHIIIKSNSKFTKNNISARFKFFFWGGGRVGGLRMCHPPYPLDFQAIV